MRRLVTVIALALPVVGLGGAIIAAEQAVRGASGWRIPITGYDPRDPLRGRYIRFQYAWRLAGPGRACSDRTCRLCLEGGGRVVRFQTPGVACPAPIDPQASGLTVFVASNGEINASARLWVSEASAPRLEAQLRAQPMVAVARLTRGGRLRPVRLEPVQSPSAQ